ncbi:sulfate/molybdate ABC transporter, substrate-binding protein [Deferribacter desulfuricans SSM1]|uniref:Sulfate/molybdate ABC transporter, substrate-binding protein n=1 Tax=Deferribacter desulfuricans (strain DSM 14783 / JCM 11476 / NBRC 101012 / SSM1) TaxID=639282 RepID=D3PA86_DEFDS|nr:tungstate ABC transporter substrate-binding protein WtpA [Deferribacter desulfuricans]BAI81626.1 sulfate/molybdate ABC transporter, substrate-binding protein [Deferribacter desulfuricans SSM1]
MRFVIKISFFVIFLSLTLFAKEKIIIFHAGSLSKPFAELEKRFEEKYPQYDVIREAAGSRLCARKVAELHKPADIVASADYKVIDNLLIPEYAKFNIHFATNEMAIAYTEKSKKSDVINSTNWPEILLNKDVIVGHSNPNLDPCGYRTMLVVKLAEKFYNINKFFDKLFGYGNFYENGEENKRKIIVRPKETDLLSLLEAGVIDYLFIYKSVAIQHGLKYIELPKEISLGDNKFKEYYSKVSFKITGKTPGSFILKKGEPMIYGITIVEHENLLPVNKKGAVEFIKFLLSKEGKDILIKNGQNVIDPPVITGDSSILQNE